ncbi:DEP domain-containing protein 1A-like [Pollicipes pollicipes]|uniref:DEP domain-containing protein 1A-like n=1 Tax=Pollicipes pollicipes TaxID=41117 RepID=UPI00188573FB|nr:DEP domain-containing protein 1A-like [Pollicipes pollicipes]
MHKVAGNQRLQLSHPAGSRDLMVSTFAGRILSPPAEREACDTVLARRLVGYLLDHHSEILAPAVQIRDAVRDRVQQQQREKVQYEETPITYCQLMSAEQYGRDRLARTSDSLLSLLDVIIADTAMSRKDKRKKLQQFRDTYPEIYSRRLLEADRQLLAAGDTRRTRSLFSGASLSSLVRSKSLRI